MVDPSDLLVRDELQKDAVALAAEAARADAAADALDRMPNGTGKARRALAQRIRRASDVALLLAGFDDEILDALADGSIVKMLHETRAAERRRRQASTAGARR